METHQAIDYLLQHVAAMFDKQLDQALQEQLGIGLAQYKIMLTIEPTAQGMVQSTIARHLGQTEASVSRQIKLLMQKGMLESTVNAKSRREHLTALTPKGFKILQAGKAIAQQCTEPLMQKLTDKQQKQLAELLSAVHAEICRPGRLAACDHPYNV